MHGIVYGARRELARRIDVDDRIRWIGDELSDGSALLVFGGLHETEAAWLRAEVLGELATVAEQEELPGLPLGPDWPRHLKHLVCLAETVLARYLPSAAKLAEIAAHPQVRGASITDAGVFVEFGSHDGATYPVHAVRGALWSAHVISWRDVRVPTPVLVG